MIDYNNKSPQIQQASQDYIHDFYVKTSGAPGLVGGDGHQHLLGSAGVPWPNHAKLFFNNKGVRQHHRYL